MLTYPLLTAHITYSHIQAYNISHTDDVVSLTVDPSGTLVASGQLGRQPKIVLWDAKTAKLKMEIKDVHRRAVSLLAFDPTGVYLASVGLDDNHVMAVHNVQNNDAAVLVGKVRTGINRVMGLGFAPVGNKFSVVTCGDQSIKFWRQIGRNFSFKKGKLGKRGTNQMFYCVGSVESDVVIGTEDGHLYRFRNANLRQAIKAHVGTVNAMHCIPGRGLCTGSENGEIKIWNNDLEVLQEFEVKRKVDSICPNVRAVCWNPVEKRILFGTAGSEIFEIHHKSGKDLNRGAVMSGHFKGAVWGLATHPTEQECVTVGDDATVRVIDLVDAKLIMQAELDSPARCVAYSPDAKYIAVGFGTPRKNKMNGFYMVCFVWVGKCRGA